MLEDKALKTSSKCPFNHVPACTAWTAVFPNSMTHMIYVQIGFQEVGAAIGQPSPVSWPTPIFSSGNHKRLQEMREWFQLPEAPLHLDCGVFDDAEGNRNWMFYGYWNDYETYQRWALHSQISQWWSSPIFDSSFGYWREIAIIPTDHIETIQQADRDHASGHFLRREVTDVHDYWGAARDRIPASATENFGSPVGKTLPNPLYQESRGKHIRVNLPANICHVRSAQDLMQIGARQRETYVNKVEPSLCQGLDYIRANPIETGCMSCRYIREVTLEGQPLEKTCGTLFFLSLEHLEYWAESHSTHQAIYAMFNKMLEIHGQEELELALWHETDVLPDGHLKAEYVNCATTTGFLPYFSEAQVQLFPKVR
jgi:hypothetical protein